MNHWSNIKTLEHVDTNGCVYPGTGNRLYEGHFKEQFNMAPEDLSICLDHGWTLPEDDVRIGQLQPAESYFKD